MGRPPTATPKSLPMSFRLPPDVKVATEKAAAADSRSVASLIEKVLTDFLRKNGHLPSVEQSLDSHAKKKP